MAWKTETAHNVISFECVQFSMSMCVSAQWELRLRLGNFASLFCHLQIFKLFFFLKYLRNIIRVSNIWIQIRPLVSGPKLFADIAVTTT